MKGCFVVLVLAFFGMACCESHADRTEPFSSVTDPQQLTLLEDRAYSFSSILEHGTAWRDNRSLFANSALYRSLVESVEFDLRARQREDPTLQPSMATAHRLFDSRFLKSSDAHFELVGVVNRLDRKPFVADESCGEIRLIYRLAYAVNRPEGQIRSRLPMTVNAVFSARDESGGSDCASIARRWRESSDATPEARVDALLRAEGPLAPLFFKEDRLKSVEINVQSVRFPSTVRPDFGGYAEYLLRVFRKAPLKQTFVLSPLENTPDVSLLKQSPGLKSELLRFLKQPENLRHLEAGTLRIPEKFLASRATSVSLHGSARLANHPFAQLFSPTDFSDVNFENNKRVRSPLSALRRLDDMTCMGCHQGRAAAGFHFLGRDRANTPSENALHLAASPHFILDAPRRRAVLEALQQGREPNWARPFSERADDGEGGIGSHCGLVPAFDTWTCNAGLRCQPDQMPLGETPVGICRSEIPLAGEACEIGRVSQEINPLKDRVQISERRDCGLSRVCERAQVGFPGGMCSAACEDLKTGETCGAIAILADFNRCLAEGRPYTSCARDHVRPGALQACDARHLCRDDYVCAATRTGGACIPPYFMFQLRVDGHPQPSVF